MANIAIIEDEVVLSNALEMLFTESGHQVRSFGDGHGFLKYLEEDEPEIAILDLRLPDMDGLDVLRAICKQSSSVITIIITAHGNVSSAVEALKTGAYDYIGKPFDLDALSILITKVLDERQLRSEVEHRRQISYRRERMESFLGNSESFLRVKERARMVAAIPQSTVLITGESGTGKELLAKAVHNMSPHEVGSFIAVNCAGLPESLLESELFGNEKGAFTGATQRRIGLAELANNGTLFLDEIGEMPMSTQVKLLRFLENRTFRRLGGRRLISFNGNITAATNCNLEEAIKNNTFRKDLFYRLNVVPLHIPPLRERWEDIPLFVNHFLNLYGNKYKKKLAFSSEVIDAFSNYAWPGNVRELANMVQMLVITEEGMVDLDLLPRRFFVNSENGIQEFPAMIPGGCQDEAGKAQPKKTLSEQVLAYERSIIEKALRESGGRKIKTAALLGISRFALERRLKYHDII